MKQTVIRRLCNLFFLFVVAFAFQAGLLVSDAHGQRQTRRPSKAKTNAAPEQKPSTEASRWSFERQLQTVTDLESEMASGDDQFLSPSLAGQDAIAGTFIHPTARIEAYVTRAGTSERVPLTQMPSLKKDDVIHLRLHPIESGIRTGSTKWTIYVAFFDYVNPTVLESHLQERKLRQNNAWLNEHRFICPGDGMIPFILLIPREDMGRSIRNFMRTEREKFSKIGEFAVTIAKQRFKFEKAVDGLSKFLLPQNQPSRNDTKSWEAIVMRVLGQSGLTLPEDWKSLKDSSTPWPQKLESLIKLFNPKPLEFGVSRALTLGVNEGVRILSGFFPGFVPMINAALVGIRAISNLFKGNNKPVELIPAMPRQPSESGLGKDTIVRTSDLFIDRPAIAEAGIAFSPFRYFRPDSKKPDINVGCIGAGENTLKEVLTDWTLNDVTRDFELSVSSSIGSIKFPLIKNSISKAWTFPLNAQQLDDLRALGSSVARIAGKLGFDPLESNSFSLNLVADTDWVVEEDSVVRFTKSGTSPRRILNIRAGGSGSCQCLSEITFYPASGEPVRFATDVIEGESIVISPDKRTASITVDVTKLPVGEGRLLVKQVGEPVGKSYKLRLYPEPPTASELKFHYREGDDKAELTGNRLEQVTKIVIDGIPATILTNRTSSKLNLSFERTSKRPQKIGTYNIILEDDRELSLVTSSPALEYKAEKPPLRLGPYSGNSFVANFSVDAVPHLDLENIQLIPTSVDKVTIQVSHDMSEYGFVANQIDSVNVRIKGQSDAISLDRDEKHLTVFAGNALEITVPLNLKINGIELRNTLAGQRLEFEIVDKDRGSSGWKTVEPAFVNVPRSLSVVCPAGLTEQCRLEGDLRMVASYRSGLSGEFTALPSNSGSSISIGPLSDLENFYVKVRGFDQQPIRVVNVRRESSP